MASGGSHSHAIYHDASRENRANDPTKRTITNAQIQDSTTSQIQTQHVAADSTPQMQWSQQQFIPAAHYNYIHHQHTSMAPVSSYYPIYLHHQPSPPQQQTDHNQYPSVYIMSTAQPNPNYDASTRPLTPPVYPTKPDTAAATMVQVPAHQFQQHYIVNPNASAAAGGGGNYGHDQYSPHLTPQDQTAYYGQQVAAPPPPQYQTMTPAAAVMYSQVSTQISSDSNLQRS